MPANHGDQSRKSQGSRMSQREELNGSAVPTKAGADPMGSAGAGAVLP